MLKFINDFFGRLGELLVKLVGSRKSAYQMLSKLIALKIILSLSDERLIVYTFLITSIADFIYFGVIVFEKVKLEYTKS